MTEEKKQLIEQFKKFLADNKADQAWLTARQVDYPNDPYRFLTWDSPKNWIANAFMWSVSDQGREYWADISRKWKKEINYFD
jgi:hypothetical protein